MQQANRERICRQLLALIPRGNPQRQQLAHTVQHYVRTQPLTPEETLSTTLRRIVESLPEGWQRHELKRLGEILTGSENDGELQSYASPDACDSRDRR